MILTKVNAFVDFLSSIPWRISNRIHISLRNVEYSEYPNIKGKLYLEGSGKFIFGKKMVINSAFKYNPVGLAPHCYLVSWAGATLKFGDNVGISNVTINARNSITIEDDVMLGGGVQVFDHDFHPLDYHKRMHDTKNFSHAPVLIEKGAFIGTRSIILKGTKIGARAVIGAGSVVIGTIPPDEIWAGNPAKFIKKITSNSNNFLRILENSDV